jgi:hypothetical protein
MNSIYETNLPGYVMPWFCALLNLDHSCVVGGIPDSAIPAVEPFGRATHCRANNARNPKVGVARARSTLKLIGFNLRDFRVDEK